MTAPDPFARSGRQSDADLIEAGRELADVLHQFGTLPDLPVEDADEMGQRLTDRLGEITELINNTPATTMAGAAVKLRLLADPEVGMEAGERDDDYVSLRQVLACCEAQP